MTNRTDHGRRRTVAKRGRAPRASNGIACFDPKFDHDREILPKRADDHQLTGWGYLQAVAQDQASATARVQFNPPPKRLVR
jgi:hypothetical protein